MNEVTVKAKDKAYKFECVLLVDGAVVENLADATAVKFLMQRIEAPYTKYSFDATVENAATGLVKCEIPASGFPTAVGSYEQEWEVMFPDSKPLTFPSDGYNKVHIIKDLN